MLKSVKKSKTQEVKEAPKESKPSEEYTIVDIPVKFQGCLAQIKLWHWTCEDLNTHKLLDKLYDKVYDLTDRLAEALIGSDMELNAGILKGYELKPFTSKEDCIEYLIMKEDFVSNMIPDQEDEVFKNILTEFSELFKKYIYLLNFK